MRTATVRVVLTLSAVLLGGQATATHLMGGNLGYRYLGRQGSYVVYEVTLRSYQNCYSPYWGGGFPEPSVTIGIYEHTSNNMPLLRQKNLPLVDTTNVIPDLPPGCNIQGSDVCISEVIYRDTIHLPFSLNGYYIAHDRCCRNEDIKNLLNPGDQGFLYTAYIPPTLVPNSSPVFSDLPTPFLCAGDTATIVNTAVDPDGDVLVFTFATPNKGWSSQVNPDPGPPNPLSLPPPPVTYKAGYNATQPFGSGGYAVINGINGMSWYMSPDTGKFVVDVEIREYRNGQLVGVTRRGLQLLFIYCPRNFAPTFNGTSQGGSSQTTFSIEEGDSLCFNVYYTDPEGDTLTLTAYGEVLNPSLVNPPATMNSPVTGIGSVSSRFCWQTTCTQGRVAPYTLIVEVSDNGCPPKTTSTVFSIEVRPFLPANSISGRDSVCAHSQTNYSVPLRTGSTYQWFVSGGSIVSGQGSNSITVEWGEAGTGTVKVVETSKYGCVADTVSKNILILPLPNLLTSVQPDTVCPGESLLLRASGANTFWWTPLDSPSIIISTADTLKVNPVQTTYYVVYGQDAHGCTAVDTVAAPVYVVETINITATDDSVCPGTPVTLTALNGSSHAWFIDPNYADTLSRTSSLTDTPTSTTTYVVRAMDAHGCPTSGAKEIYTYPQPNTPQIFGPRQMCPGASGITYWIDSPLNGSTFWWDISGGRFLNPTNNDTVIVAWDTLQLSQDTLFAWLKAVEISKHGCVSDTGFLQIILTLTYQPDAPFGPDSLCFSMRDTIRYFSFCGPYGYQWFVRGGTLLPPDTLCQIYVNWQDTLPSINLIWYERADTGWWNGSPYVCRAISDTLQVVVFPPLPPLSLLGDSTQCIGKDTATVYIQPASTAWNYVWWAEPGITLIPDTHSAHIITLSEDTYTVYALVYDQWGCVSDTLTYRIYSNNIPDISITGPATLCLPGDTLAVFTVLPPLSEDSVVWSLTGGTFTYLGRDSAVAVISNTGNYILTAYLLTPIGCTGDTHSLSLRAVEPSINLQVVSTLEPNEKDIIIKWQYQGEGTPLQVLLWGRQQNEPYWQFLGTFSTNRYIHLERLTDQYFYEYLAALITACTDTVYSPVHRSLLLTGEKKEQGRTGATITLQWNSYINWDEPVQQYEIWQSINDTTVSALTPLVTLPGHPPALDTTYTYQLSDVRSGFTRCYRIYARKQNDTLTSLSNIICFELAFSLFIPDVFTPNGDGINDTWQIGNIELYPDNQIEVYNRWGTLVFKATGYHNEWDGTYQGKPLPEATYYYVLTATHPITGRKTTYTGSVTIVR